MPYGKKSGMKRGKKSGYKKGYGNKSNAGSTRKNPTTYKSGM